MSKELHIFDYSFLLSQKELIFGHPQDYKASISEKGHDTIVCGGQLPVWDLKVDENREVFSLKHERDKNNETLALLINKGRYESIYIYFEDKLYGLNYIGDMNELLFAHDEMKTIQFLKDFYQSKGNKEYAQFLKNEIDNWFEDNFEIDLGGE
mgnify:CR=1 FL=1